MMRKCIVRDLYGSHDTTAPMNCANALNLAKSGKWGKDWSLEECIENTNGSVPILQIAIRFKNGKYEYLNHDEYFKRILTE